MVNSLLEKYREIRSHIVKRKCEIKLLTLTLLQGENLTLHQISDQHHQSRSRSQYLSLPICPRRFSVSVANISTDFIVLLQMLSSSRAMLRAILNSVILYVPSLFYHCNLSRRNNCNMCPPSATLHGET